MTRSLATTIALLGLSAAASAQYTLFTKEGANDGDYFGAFTRFIGDVNGDGIADWAVSAPHSSIAGAPAGGRVRIYSGRNGNGIRVHRGSLPYENLGSSIVDHGDIDGDGVSDYAIGSSGYDGVATRSGRVTVFSGIDGSVIRTLDGTIGHGYFGGPLDSGGDVDGDGVPDLLVSSSNATTGAYRAGRVSLFSGATGAHILDVDGSSHNELRGAAISFVDDTDGDGFDDFVTGARWASVPDVRLHSGATGALLHVITPVVNVDHRMGQAVDGIGDVDGDGRGDYLVAADEGRIVDAMGNITYRVGRIRVHSGATGAVLTTIEGERQYDDLGRDAISVPDRDGDGLRDIASLGGYTSIFSKRILVHSSATGEELDEFPLVVNTVNGFGAQFSGGTDVSGDGVGDFIVGNYRWPSDDDYRGRATLLSGAPHVGVDATCDGPHSSYAATMFAQGSSLAANNDVSLHVVNVVPDTFGYFLTSPTTALGPNFNGYLSLCVGGAAPIGRYAGNVIQVGEERHAQQEIDLTSVPSPTGSVSITAGDTQYFQFWFRRGAGSDFSTTIGITFQ